MRLLKERARSASPRNPVVLVPPVLAVRLVDGAGRPVWGQTRHLWRGPSVSRAQNVKPAGLIEAFTIVPGLVSHDVFGGMVRFLEDIGGYRRGQNLFHLDYDWRGSVADGAEELAKLIDRLRGGGDEQIDLVCVSSGGMVARYYLAVSQSSVGVGDVPRPPLPIRRVVYVASPQRGTFSALANAHEGIVLAPFGKRFNQQEVGSCQIIYDSLPHPDERIFIDERGEPLDLDHYDSSVWRELALGDHGLLGLQHRLDHAKKIHRTLDQLSTHPAAVVMGGAHVATPSRATVQNGKVFITDCCSIDDNPAGDRGYVPGDGSVPIASLLLPEMEESAVWKITPQDHHMISKEPEVHRLTLEGLLTAECPIPAFHVGPTFSRTLVRDAS